MDQLWAQTEHKDYENGIFLKLQLREKDFLQ